MFLKNIRNCSDRLDEAKNNNNNTNIEERLRFKLKKNGNKYAKIIKILENTRLKWIEKNNREQLETERYDFNDKKNM